jgi:uncharacterized protein YyaL (SSP411 family)
VLTAAHQVRRQADRMLGAVAESLQRGVPEPELPPPLVAARAVSILSKSFDGAPAASRSVRGMRSDRRATERLGGFGKRPKFPRPVNFNFLLVEYARAKANGDAGADRLLHMITFTLDCMARGVCCARGGTVVDPAR